MKKKCTWKVTTWGESHNDEFGVCEKLYRSEVETTEVSVSSDTAVFDVII